MKNLFYENKEQLLEIFDKFSESILAKKQTDSAFFTPYRKFKYKDELVKTSFDYAPQNPNSFIEEFSNFFENAINFDAPGVMYNVHPNPNVYGQIASFLPAWQIQISAWTYLLVSFLRLKKPL